MPNLIAAIWRTISTIKLLCFPRCVPELLLSHLPKFVEFYLCIQMLPTAVVLLFVVRNIVEFINEVKQWL